MLYEFKFLGKSLWIRDCKGPINPAWVPSMEALVFGGFFMPADPKNPNRKFVIFDPSNAPDGYPARDAKDYPLFYAIGGDGKPVGNPVLVFNGRSFDSEDDIIKYLASVVQRDANLAEWQRQFNAQVWKGPVEAASLSQNDRAWLYVMSHIFRDEQVKVAGKIINGDLFRTVLSGKNVDISRVINDGEADHRWVQNAGTPDNKELERVVKEAIEAAKQGKPPEQAY